MFINALTEARDSFASGSAQGAIDAFAQTRADIQTRNTYSTIASGAMKWVPLLNIVLTVVFYSLFPILFLLMLLPTNGMTVAKGYITGFFYLAAWGPLFVILNMIFMSRWQDSLASWGANGGMTAANRSEEHTSELQSLMRISYAVFCLKKQKSQAHERQHNKTSRRIKRREILH